MGDAVPAASDRLIEIPFTLVDMRSHRATLLLLLVVASSLIVTGCAAPPRPPEATQPLGLTIGVPTDSSPPTLDPVEVAVWVDFRKLYGLRADLAWVLMVATDPRSMNGIGVPLLPSEMEELGGAVSSVADVTPVLRLYGEAHPDVYGGVFVDGKLAVLQMKGDPTGHRAALLTILSATAPFEVRQAAWSVAELEAFAATVEAETDWFRSIGAEFVASDVGVAGVRVRYLAPNDRPDALIRSHFGNPGWILIEWSGPLPWKGPRGTLVVEVTNGSGESVVGATCDTSPIDPAVDADMGVVFVTNDEGVCTIPGLPATAFEVTIVVQQGQRDVVATTAHVVVPEDATIRLSLVTDR